MSPTPLRPRARAGVVLTALLAALVASVVVATGASAHVTVSSDDAAAGGYGKLTFRVPNESDTASTVGVRIQIPEEAALAFLSVQPVAGWEVSTTTSDLPEPVEAEGQELTSYVSVVEFSAEDGGGIAPGEFQEFSLSGGPFPEVESVAFPTVQTYSDGTESAWIEPTVDGEEPEFPAPTLTLTAAPEATEGAEASEGAGASEASDPSGSAVASSTDTVAPAEDSGNGPACGALVVSVAALLAGLAGVALGVSPRRRTVSS